MDQGGTYTRPCDAGSTKTIYRICCTPASIGQSRGGSSPAVTCTPVKFGTWLPSDTRECVQEVQSILQSVGDVLETSLQQQQPANTRQLAEASSDVASLLQFATTRLTDTANADGGDNTTTTGAGAQDSAEVKRLKQGVVLEGVRTVALLASTASKSANATVDPVVLKQVFSGINVLALTSGAATLELNASDVQSQLEGTGVDVDPSSPFAFTGQLRCSSFSVSVSSREQKEVI